MMATSGLQAQASRLRLVSENMANMDTPGFRRKIAAFEQVLTSSPDQGAVKQSGVQLDKTTLPKIHDPSHPLADAQGYYEGSNVNIIVEMADAREAQRSYEANIKMFEQARKMSSAVLDILRR